MNAHYSLENTLLNILRVVNPTEDDWNKRLEILDNLQAVVESLEILRGATVEPFGSFVSNLFTRWGDLDISIELPNGIYISTVGNKYKQGLLSDIQQSLRINGGFDGVKFIYHARVPILTCNRKKSKISCDISINNLKGQMKSKILLWINDIDGRFRDMVLLVKEWAKTHGINDPKTGTLNSFSLSLLVIFHFQTCEPAILPPLNEIYPGNMVDDLKGVRAIAEQNIEDICRQNINRIKSDKSRMINRSSLAEMFISFLDKFCDISLRASEQGISPYNGQWEDIENNMTWQPKTYQLFIEDPFEQPNNCARGMSNHNLRKIAEAFQSSLNKLTSADQNHHINVLVRPEVLSIMLRHPVTSLDNIGMNHPRTHPQFHRNHISNGREPSYRKPRNNGEEHHHSNGGSQVYRGGCAPPQLHQHQFQSNHVIGVNLRHGQASQNQDQQFQGIHNNGVNLKNGQASQNQVQRVQSNPNNGVNHNAGQASHGQVQRFRITPKNNVDQKRGQASQSQVQSNPKNGVSQRRGQASASEVTQVQSNPNNRVSGQASQSRVQQIWRPKSEK